MANSYLVNARAWMNEGITTNDFMIYPVDFTKVESEEFVREFGEPEDKWEFISIRDIDDWSVRIPKLYDAVEWDQGELDEEYMTEVYDGLIRPSKHYLVYASGCRWNGASGYKYADSLIEALDRSYDVDISVNGITPGGKTLELCESSHDVPTGSLTYVISLTDREYHNLKENDGDFAYVRNFVESNAKKVRQ